MDFAGRLQAITKGRPLFRSGFKRSKEELEERDARDKQLYRELARRQAAAEDAHASIENDGSDMGQNDQGAFDVDSSISISRQHAANMEYNSDQLAAMEAFSNSIVIKMSGFKRSAEQCAEDHEQRQQMYKRAKQAQDAKAARLARERETSSTDDLDSSNAEERLSPDRIAKAIAALEEDPHLKISAGCITAAASRQSDTIGLNPEIAEEAVWKDRLKPCHPYPLDELLESIQWDRIITFSSGQSHDVSKNFVKDQFEKIKSKPWEYQDWWKAGAEQRKEWMSDWRARRESARDKYGGNPGLNMYCLYVYLAIRLMILLRPKLDINPLECPVWHLGGYPVKGQKDFNDRSIAKIRSLDKQTMLVPYADGRVSLCLIVPIQIAKMSSSRLLSTICTTASMNHLQILD